MGQGWALRKVQRMCVEASVIVVVASVARCDADMLELIVDVHVSTVVE